MEKSDAYRKGLASGKKWDGGGPGGPGSGPYGGGPRGPPRGLDNVRGLSNIQGVDHSKFFSCFKLNLVFLFFPIYWAFFTNFYILYIDIIFFFYCFGNIRFSSCMWFLLWGLRDLRNVLCILQSEKYSD